MHSNLDKAWWLTIIKTSHLFVMHTCDRSVILFFPSRQKERQDYAKMRSIASVSESNHSTIETNFELNGDFFSIQVHTQKKS